MAPSNNMWCALAVVLLASAVIARPEPDSAGIVPLVNGLAYGGIPYGSVTGMVAQYQARQRGITGQNNGDYNRNNVYGRR